MGLRAFLASLLLLQIVPQPNTHVGPPPGIIGGAGGACATSSRTFDGATQYFTGADVHAAGAFTFACWVNISDVAAVRAVAAEDDGTNRDWTLQTVTTTGQVRMYGFSGGAGAFAPATTALTPGSWFLVAGAYDGANNVKASVNGDAWVSQVMGGAIDNDGPGLWVGRASTSYMKGREGTCAYWASELTAGPASNLLSIYSNLTTSCSTLQATYGAAHCWNMGAAAGANESDQIGATDLTQVNSPGSSTGPGCP